jgi:hypothetical protein
VLSLKKVVSASLLAGAVLLTGCGRTAGSLVQASAGAFGASGAVGIPGSYQAGRPFAGAEGVPTLNAVTWPKMTVTSEGKTSDPVNLIVAGSEAQVRHVFGSQGWTAAEKISAISTAKMIKQTVTMGDYANAPMSALFLYNRIMDQAWQKNNVGTYQRDHLRVWQTPLKDHLGRPFWAIAATKDVAVKWNYKSMLPTHQISPDIDAERQLVVNDFLKSGQVKLRYQLQSLAPEFKGSNGGGDEFYSDGKVEVLELVTIRPAN